ncbi:MAG: restriction endonuclease subunit S [Saprospiraceae bacterium]|nr:restriction endonuclease subunit S [Saprospiraceae bacterium]
MNQDTNFKKYKYYRRIIRHSKDIDKYFLGEIENLEKYLVKENDIVIGMDGSKVGKNVALVGKEDENSILIQRVARIRTNENSGTHFLYQYFISDKFRNYVDTVNTSSEYHTLVLNKLKDFKVRFP